MNSVGKLRKDRSIPILLTNKTNRRIKVHRHAIVARVEKENQKLSEVNSILKTCKNHGNIDFNNLDVPEESRKVIQNLILRNSDIFASKDSELGHTDMVTMKIDTGNNAPIKLRPYRTPLNNRHVIDEAIDEMLDAKIIQLSQSPWSFPVVIVDKKDGSKRFCVDFRK